MADEDFCVSVRPRSSGKPRGKAPTIGGPWTAVVGGYVHSITGEPYVKGQNKKETDAAYEKKRRKWRSAAHRREAEGTGRPRARAEASAPVPAEPTSVARAERPKARRRKRARQIQTGRETAEEAAQASEAPPAEASVPEGTGRPRVLAEASARVAAESVARAERAILIFFSSFLF